MNINYPVFWKSASSRRKRIYSAAFIFIIAILATIIGFFVPPSLQDAQQIDMQLNQTVTQGKLTATCQKAFS
jgi:cell division protein FtsN